MNNPRPSRLRNSTSPYFLSSYSFLPMKMIMNDPFVIQPNSKITCCLSSEGRWTRGLHESTRFKGCIAPQPSIYPLSAASFGHFATVSRLCSSILQSRRYRRLYPLPFPSLRHQIWVVSFSLPSSFLFFVQFGSLTFPQARKWASPPRWAYRVHAPLR